MSARTRPGRRRARGRRRGSTPRLSWPTNSASGRRTTTTMSASASSAVAVGDDLGAHLRVRGVRHPRGGPGACLNGYCGTRGHQLRDRTGNQCDPGLTRRRLCGGGDAHAGGTLRVGRADAMLAEDAGRHRGAGFASVSPTLGVEHEILDCDPGLRRHGGVLREVRGAARAVREHDRGRGSQGARRRLRLRRARDLPSRRQPRGLRPARRAQGVIRDRRSNSRRSPG